MKIFTDWSRKIWETYCHASESAWTSGDGGRPNEERIDAVMPYVTNAQIGDSVNADFLRSLGVGNYDVCIVTIGSSFQDSLEPHVF